MEKQTIECTVSVKTSMDNVSSLVFMVDTTKDEITKIMLRTAIKRILERDLGISLGSDGGKIEPFSDFHKAQKLNQAAASIEPHVTDLTDWIDWYGGEPPVKNGKVDVKLRNGEYMDKIHADTLRWQHAKPTSYFKPEFDIIAYRLAK